MITKSLNAKLPVVCLFLVACGSSSSKTTDAAATADDSGGNIPVDVAVSVSFMGVEPCGTESAFVDGTTVSFPNDDVSYSPKCLKVAVGDPVTFMATAGDFSMHPLEPSRRRGDALNNPITTTMTTTTSRAFTFSVSGFFGYYCTNHGSDTDGSGMAGVIWVR